MIGFVNRVVSPPPARHTNPLFIGWLREVQCVVKFWTNLELLLRRRGIDTIIITGIETNVCCDTTVREAMVRDFRVFFLSDGTTTGGVQGLSREEVQRATLATMGMLFAQILTVDEMIQKIESAIGKGKS